MKEYTREYPAFSLCGLNCGLCPRYQTDGSSKCPGCGGKDFHLKHPACSVISCSKKHGNVEYCFQCSSYPCEKYSHPSSTDSFISYQHVLSDFEKAEQEGLDAYKKELDARMEFLEFLIRTYNDGRKKNYYCLGVSLLSWADLSAIKYSINTEISGEDGNQREKIGKIVKLFENKAKERDIKLKLRKPSNSKALQGNAIKIKKVDKYE